MNDKRTTHTPGPWRAGCDGWCLWRADYDGEADVASHQPISSVAGETVCLIVGIGDDETEFDANARLIAAAPDLLSALRPFANLAVARAELDEPDEMVVAAYVDGFGREARKTRVTLGDCRAALAAIAAAEVQS